MFLSNENFIDVFIDKKRTLIRLIRDLIQVVRRSSRGQAQVHQQGLREAQRVAGGAFDAAWTIEGEGEGRWLAGDSSLASPLPAS